MSLIISLEKDICSFATRLWQDDLHQLRFKQTKTNFALLPVVIDIRILDFCDPAFSCSRIHNLQLAHRLDYVSLMLQKISLF